MILFTCELYHSLIQKIEYQGEQPVSITRTPCTKKNHIHDENQWLWPDLKYSLIEGSLSQHK